MPRFKITGFFLIFILCLFLVFAIGYSLGCKSQISNIEKTRVVKRAGNPIGFLSKPASIEKNGGSQEIEKRQLIFSETVQLYMKQREELLNKINELNKIKEYFSSKADDADGALSIEASLVHEARYRDNLGMLVDSEKDLIVLYDRLVQVYRDYVSYLEENLKVE